MDYKDAGVDVEAGRVFVQQLQSIVQRTYRSEVLGGLGGFSGLFQLPAGYREPVLVSGTDGQPAPEILLCRQEGRIW